MAEIHTWHWVGHACCPGCRGFSWHCPSCGEVQSRQLTDEGCSFPLTGPIQCTDCGVLGTVTLLGWSPSAVLQQAFDLPAAQRPQPPAEPRQDGSGSGQKRLTVNQWRRVRDGALSRRLKGVTAPEVREAHVRNGGASTYRGGHRTYSRSELLRALDLIDRRGGVRRG